MLRLSRIFAVLALLPALPAAQAEVWQTTQGDRVEGRLSGVYGYLAVVTGKGGSTLLSLEELDDPGLRRVADYLAAAPGNPPAWKTSDSKVAKSLRGRLQVLRDGKIVAFDPGARPEPEFYLVYFGAHWCPPCRQFSPGFVRTYERLKQAAGDRFEVIFVSSDRDAAEQSLYIHELNMPWPVLKYSAFGSATAVEHWAGPAIPCLVVLTRDGELIFHTFHGTEYLGPADPLGKFEALLQTQTGASPEGRRALHRLAVLQYLRKVGAGSSPPAPYLIEFDRAHYQALTDRELVAHLDLDEHGRVTDAQFEPQQTSVIEHQLMTDADKWLFLPAVQDGQALRQKVVLPIKL
jgi:thiol-disulfide isomerase/thioredoxin